MKNMLLGLLMMVVIAILFCINVGVRFKNDYLLLWLNPFFLSHWRGRLGGIASCFYYKQEWDVIEKKRERINHQEALVSLKNTVEIALEDFGKALKSRWIDAEKRWKAEYVIRCLNKAKRALHNVADDDSYFYKNQNDREIACEATKEAAIAMFAYRGWLPTCMAISVRDLTDNMFWEAYWLGKELREEK